MYEVGSEIIPMRWTCVDGREVAKGMTLTAFGALDDGIFELVRMKRWMMRKQFWFGPVLEKAIAQAHLRAAVQDATVRLDRAGAAKGKARAVQAKRSTEMAERNREFGFV